MNRHLAPLNLCLIFLLLTLVPLRAQAQAAYQLSASAWQNGQIIELDKADWKYTPNDDARFADPQFDDSAWETIQGTSFTPQHLPRSGWRGLGWFRLRLNVDAVWLNQACALMMAHHGASEVYLDGKLIHRYGTVGTTPENEVEANPGGVPLEFAFDKAGEHLLAVRRSQARWQQGFNWRGPSLVVLLGSDVSAVNLTETGFRIQLDRLSSAYVHRDQFYRRAGVRGIIVGSIFAALGLLHLLFFFFYPPQRANLWFGLYVFCVTLLFILARMSLNTVQDIAQGIPAMMNLFTVGYFLTGAIDVFMLAFLYASFERRLPKAFYIFAAIRFLAGAVVYLLPYAELSRWIRMSQLLLVPCVWLYVTAQAIRRKESGAILIGLGVALFSLNPINSLLLETGYGPQVSAFVPIQQAATVIINILFSVYLARQFARTNRNLETQLEQVVHLSKKELEHEREQAEIRLQREQERVRLAEVEAEHDRKTKELEDARQLQLSMLPKKLPDLPQLDLAAYMKTATEVGGDYYDFHLGEDGTLTVAVGDATGHGLRAGTLVSVIKSLFVSLAYHPDIPHIFARSTRVLKEMKLRGLFMALTMVKLRGSQLSFSIAGMPSLLIYRARSGTVEEAAIYALPLGSFTSYEYQQQELTLSANDIVILMSDGLPERFNPQGEMLDYERIHNALPMLAHLSSAQIIEALARLGEDWATGKSQEDDVTLVVLKFKADDK